MSSKWEVKNTEIKIVEMLIKTVFGGKIENSSAFLKRKVKRKSILCQISFIFKM